MSTRRQFLTGSAAMVAAMGLPIRAVAATPAERKFLFVFNPGGWDPTRVLVPAFDNPNVSMEAVAEPLTVGNLRVVDHPDRPSVRGFFEAHHARSVVLNGLMVRSIAHEICTMIAMTGTSEGTAPDWPAVLAASQKDGFTLPHLVLSGPSFPGDLGVAVARTGVNGQLAALLSGRALDNSDMPVRSLSAPAESVIDRYLARRVAARAGHPLGAVDARLTADMSGSLAKASALKDLQYGLDLAAGNGLADQIGVAVDALSMGVSRCVTLAHAGAQLGWDTHTNNDADQSVLWEELFQGLNQLVALLDATPGTSAPTLAEETTVVVLSEMGRTPAMNAFSGKDHWPYTAALLFGAGLQGDRQIGSFDTNFYGQPIDPVTGDVSETGQVLSAESLGATLLAMADIDPEEYVSGVSPVLGVVE
jgi:uncharacterized protein (DUF1501 family)